MRIHAAGRRCRTTVTADTYHSASRGDCSFRRSAMNRLRSVSPAQSSARA